MGVYAIHIYHGRDGRGTRIRYPTFITAGTAVAHAYGALGLIALPLFDELFDLRAVEVLGLRLVLVDQ